MSILDVIFKVFKPGKVPEEIKCNHWFLANSVGPGISGKDICGECYTYRKDIPEFKQEYEMKEINESIGRTNKKLDELIKLTKEQKLAEGYAENEKKPNCGDIHYSFKGEVGSIKCNVCHGWIRPHQQTTDNDQRSPLIKEVDDYQKHSRASLKYANLLNWDISLKNLRIGDCDCSACSNYFRGIPKIMRVPYSVETIAKYCCGKSSCEYHEARNKFIEEIKKVADDYAVTREGFIHGHTSIHMLDMVRKKLRDMLDNLKEK